MRLFRLFPPFAAVAWFAATLTPACGQGSPSDPGLHITRLSTSGTAVVLDFADTGTGATGYRLESAADLGPGVGPGSDWAEVAGTQPTPLGNGQFRFAATVAERQRAFFRVRTALFAVIDTDGDGLDDAWERRYFGSLDSLAGADADGDGYSNLLEFKAGTDPRSLLSQPAIPLVQFVDEQLTVLEQEGSLALALSLNKAWTGTLQFEVQGTAGEPSEVGPIPRSIEVAGASATLVVPLHDDAESLEPIRWVTLRLLDAGGYAVSTNRSVTVRIQDNEQLWSGSFAKFAVLTNARALSPALRALTNRLSELTFGLDLRRQGASTSGRLTTRGSLLPNSPEGGFPLASFSQSGTGEGSVSFDSGWLPLPPDTSFLGGLTHVRLHGNTTGTNQRSASGLGTLSLGSPSRGAVAEISGQIDLALLPTRFQAGRAKLTPTKPAQ